MPVASQQAPEQSSDRHVAVMCLGEYEWHHPWMRVDGGYFDVQINGGWGHHFSDDPSSIWTVGTELLALGVTQFLPTLISEGYNRFEEALDTLASGPPAGWVGAIPVGWHLEGPWLAVERVGAHRLESLELPDLDRLHPLLGRDHGVALLTLAPELPGALEVITELVDRGVVVSLGHSNATFEQAMAGFAAGARMGTHLFNAMSGLHHRAPGLAAALLSDDFGRAGGPCVGIIADGEHVAPEMIRLANRLIGSRLLLVSDAVSLLGSGDDRPVAKRTDGTLMGATVGLDRCVANLVAFTGCTMHAAVSAASNVPRRLLSVDAVADTYVEIDDAGVVMQTVMAGSAVYVR